LAAQSGARFFWRPVGRQQRHHAVGLQPAALDQALQQALAVAEDAHRLGLSFSPVQFTGSQPGVR
jgi:hypothetical protein